MPPHSQSSSSKIVRFARTDSMYNIPANRPRAPQLANSDNTPPTRVYRLTPALACTSRRGSLPEYNTDRTYLDHYSPPHAHHPSYASAHRYLTPHGIVWDIRDAPRTITRSGHSIHSRALYEPACGPAQSFMRMTLMTTTGGQLPWSVNVYASSQAGYVTLEDLVLAVHATLRVNITCSDYALLRKKDDQTRAVLAYEERYRRLRSEYAYREENSEGMKRVDFLMGRTRLIGLEQNRAMGANEWTLRLG